MNLSRTKYGLKAAEIAAIQNVFKLFPNLNKVIIYGSRAKGNYRPGSDIDLSLQGKNLDYQDLVAIENSLDDLLLPYTIDLSIYNLIENSDLIDHINRVGGEFYLKV
ncbi:MAG: hypothetical protein S4CHLAM7_02000 [Chlamydiae bacterium]|nr:hypothetical protein [Chlamydiota bacterium]